MCLYPQLLKNPKYKPNKKNGGHVPAVCDIRVLYIPKGCGNCIECRKQKSREWRVRLNEDIKTNTNAKMITLTFSNKSYTELGEKIKSGIKLWTLTPKKHKWNYTKPYIKKPIKILCSKINISGYDLDNAIATLAVRRWLERYRKKYKKSIRHWLVTELGHKGTENIHLHGLIWTNETLETIEKLWQYGFIHKGKYNQKTGKYINYVNSETINYMVKYVTKIDLQHQHYRQVILTSSGIGANYTNTMQAKRNKYNGENTNEAYRLENGGQTAMPMYLRNKIYTDTQKEQLWLQRLDKQERYILGQKIDISAGLDTYWKALDAAKIQNKSLGYGSDQVNWDRKKYEDEIRKLKQASRGLK